MTTRELLEQLVAEAAPAELPQIAAELARALSLAISHSARVAPPIVKSDHSAKRLLTVDEAAAKMGVSHDWLYRSKDLPFRKKISRNVLRFDEAGIDRWLAAR